MSALQTHEGLTVTGDRDEAALPGTPGAAAFPPSAVSVSAAEHGSPRNTFKVTITDLEQHGDLIRVRAGISRRTSLRQPMQR